MRGTDTRKTNYSVSFVCEGTHTEPNFFGAMVDWLRKNGKSDFDVQIHPKPTITPDDNELDLNRGASGRKKRTPKNDTEEKQKLEEEDKFPGQPPLNWVKAGIKQLSTYDEVWVIFDKDGHPKTPEAFAAAEENVIEGKKVNIAFSSRCFEYYLLLHFELIYKAFEKSECNEKKYYKNRRKPRTKSYYCMTSRAVKGKACQGDKCINGYARLKGHWEDSKGTDSTFALVKDKLWIGICNAHTVRWKSNLTTPETVFYTRNPYVDVDKLICRLLGYNTIEHEEMKSIQSGKDYCCMKREKNIITFTLESNRTIIIPSGSIEVYNSLTGERREAGIRLMLTSDQTEKTLDLQSIMTNDEYCIITVLSKSYFCMLLPKEEFLNA